MKKKNTTGNNRRMRIWLAVALLALLLGLTAAWKWSPLADQVDIRKITAWAVSLRKDPARHVIIPAAYLTGSLVSFPVTLLIFATAIVFGPLVGSAYSLPAVF